MFVLIYYASIITRRDVLHESNNFLKLCDVRIDNKNLNVKVFVLIDTDRGTDYYYDRGLR